MNSFIKKGLSMLLSLCLVGGSCAAIAESAYTDGVYEGAASGMGGDVHVTVTVEGGRITAVEVGEHNETAGLSDPAIEKIPAAIVEAQSTEVEAVSGATITSEAIKAAVNAALNGTTEEQPATEIPFEQADVIVVGAGLAGLSAAVRASELGANVLVFEQMPRVGGSAAVAGGSIVGAGTKIEKEAGIEDSVELLYADFGRLGGEGNYNPEVAMKFAERSGSAVDWLDEFVGVNFGERQPTYGSYEPLNVNRVNYNPEVAMKFAERSGSAVDWLDEFVGVNFGERQPTYGSYEPLNVNRVHYAVPEDGDVSRSSGKGGSGFISALMTKLDGYIASGTACLLLNTPVTDIIIEDGVITGVTAEVNGETTTFKAPSTILATGGYGHNEAWLKEFNFTNVATSTPASANGSGYDFARKAGAVFSGMDFCTAYGGAIPATGFTKSIAANLYTNPGPIWVGLDGKRFTDETTADSKVRSDSWTNAKENKVFVVYTEDAVNPEMPMITGAEDPAAKLDELIAEGKYAFKADTVKELAEKAGIDAEALEATIATYNADCAAGKDSVFGRENDLRAMDKGPYYALMTIPYVLITSGGPQINADAQMINEAGEAIPGAYLAGEIVGMANVCGHTTIGGIGHGNCVTWGMIAAENAVANAGK